MKSANGAFADELGLFADELGMGKKAKARLLADYEQKRQKRLANIAEAERKRQAASVEWGSSSEESESSSEESAGWSVTNYTLCKRHAWNLCDAQCGSAKQ